MDESKYIIQPTIRTVRLRNAILLALGALVSGIALGWVEHRPPPCYEKLYDDHWRDCTAREMTQLHRAELLELKNQRCELDRDQYSDRADALEKEKEERHERARTRRP